MVRWNEMVILLGDHKQLPPFLRKTEEPIEKLSFFEACISLGVSRRVLSIQYRMHPEILAFPNTTFYKGEIVCVDGLMEKRVEERRSIVGQLQWPSDHHLLIVDCSKGKEKRRESSSYNSVEAKLCAKIASRLMRSSKLDMAVITFYRAQVDELKNRLAKQNLEPSDALQVDTVDAFQGREADVVIISMVRAAGQNVGFLSEPRRINVALTRAKSLLIVLCNVKTIKQDQLLGAWFLNCKENGVKVVNPEDFK